MFFNRAAELSRLRMENAELKEQVEKLQRRNEKLKHRKIYIKTYDVNMLLSSIAIPKNFGTPHPDKLAACEEFYKKYGVLDRKIIIYHGHVVDGYVGLLTLLAHGVKTAKVLKVEAVMV